MLSTPVIFLIYNRPELTRRVFQAIRQVRPNTLFVIADGPRLNEPRDYEKCAAARAVIDTVDWPCAVVKNYSDANLGCRRRVSSGITWAFSQINEAIILEDDCLPANSFFRFCSLMLDRYRNDSRIMHINGSNYQCRPPTLPYSYCFSKYSLVWGWATWRRAWQHYEPDIKSWPEIKQNKSLDHLHDSIYEQRYWSDTFDNYYQGMYNSWAYAWIYSCWVQAGLSVCPSVNLVSNLGFGDEATHTQGSSHLACAAVDELSSDIKHPPCFVRNRQADVNTFDNYFPGRLMRKSDRTLSRLASLARYIRSRSTSTFAHAISAMSSRTRTSYH